MWSYPLCIVHAYGGYQASYPLCIVHAYGGYQASYPGDFFLLPHALGIRQWLPEREPNT